MYNLVIGDESAIFNSHLVVCQFGGPTLWWKVFIPEDFTMLHFQRYSEGSKSLFLVVMSPKFGNDGPHRLNRKFFRVFGVRTTHFPVLPQLLKVKVSSSWGEFRTKNGLPWTNGTQSEVPLISTNARCLEDIVAALGSQCFNSLATLSWFGFLRESNFVDPSLLRILHSL